MEDEKKILWVLGILIAATVLSQYTTIFSIFLQSPETVYYNQPILIRFTTNFTNPVITTYLNDVKLYEITSYQVNETVITPVFNETTNSTVNVSSVITTNKTYSQNVSLSIGKENSTYFIRVSNLSSTGVIKFTVSEGSTTETQTVTVQRAFVDMKNNFPNSTKEGETYKLIITTYDPQGNALEADSVDVNLTNPLNQIINLSFEKSNNTFTLDYSYISPGIYFFKVYPRKAGYDTKEFIINTTVSGMPITSCISDANCLLSQSCVNGTCTTVASKGISVYVWVAIGAAAVAGYFMFRKKKR